MKKNTSSLLLLLILIFPGCQNEVVRAETNQAAKGNEFIEIDKQTKLNKEKSHILMYHPWGTKSHRGQQNALIVGLLDKGHTVTGIFSEKSDLNHDNYDEIVVETRYILFTFIVFRFNLTNIQPYVLYIVLK